MAAKLRYCNHLALQGPFQIQHLVMKTTRSFRLPIFIAVLLCGGLIAWQEPTPGPLTLTEQNLADKTVYFYMEAECDDCRLDPSSTDTRYLIVSRGVQSDLYQTHNKWLSLFGQTLQQQFAGNDRLSQALVFSFHFNAKDCEKMRSDRMEQKRKAGYTIIEVAPKV